MMMPGLSGALPSSAVSGEESSAVNRESAGRAHRATESPLKQGVRSNSSFSNAPSQPMPTGQPTERLGPGKHLSDAELRDLHDMAGSAKPTTTRRVFGNAYGD